MPITRRLDEESRTALLAIAAAHSRRRGALLPILHGVQDHLGCVPAEAVPLIAEILNLSRADVHGVISFYHDFRDAPATRPVIKLCRAEACQARGVAEVAPSLEADQRVMVETVYCLGLCASGPAAMVGDRLYGPLDQAGVKRLLEDIVR